jgi:hypothetical protein
MANPANQPISEKLPKWHFNPCMKFEFIFSQMTSFAVLKNSP